MPRYHSYKHIIVTPAPWWHRFWPYFVGDTVDFVLRVDNIPDPETGTIKVFEKFRDQEYPLMEVTESPLTIHGSVISVEGDVVYTLGFASQKKQRPVLVTAKALNYDTIFFSAFWLVVGALLTGVCGLALWVIQMSR